MRILEIGKYYPPSRGGMETALEDLARHLVTRGHRVRCLVSAGEADERYEVRDGVEVWRLAEFGRFASVPLTPSLPSALRRSLLEFRPDVVHLHLPHPGGALAWMGARSPVPLVITYHSDIVRQRLLGLAWSPWQRRLLGHAASIHVTSEAMREESSVLAPFRSRCEVIPLGVDVRRWSEVAPGQTREWESRLGNDFFLFVGRLVYYKGLDVAFEAMEGTSCRLVIAGDGPMRDVWTKQVVARGLEDQVVFLGEVSAERLPSLYHASAAFLLPSQAQSEAFGIVQLEAMAAGKAVVACRASGGVASVHEDGRTALLVAPGNPAALREAMQRLQSDPAMARRMGERGRERVEDLFALDRCVDRLEDLLIQSASGRRTAP